MTLFSFLFVTLLATSLMASDKGQLAQTKKVETILAQLHVPLSKVKVTVLDSAHINDVNIELDTIEPIKIMDIEVPSQSKIEYKGDFLSSIYSKEPITVGKYRCTGGIGFQNGRLCSCLLVESIEETNFSLPKGSYVVFGNDNPQIVRSSGEWRYKEKTYKAGSYSVNVNNAVTLLSTGSFPVNQCENISEENVKKATQMLKDMKIDNLKIRIVSSFSLKEYREDYTYYRGDHYIEFTVLNPIFLKKYNLPVGTRVVLVDKVIREIELPKQQILKINKKYECAENLEFSSDAKICSCNIVQDIVVNKYKIKAPAVLYFDKKEFSHFSPKDLDVLSPGFYVLEKGEPVFSADLERFNCGD